VIPGDTRILSAAGRAGMQGKITKRAVDGFTPVSDAETVLWDTEVKGFGIPPTLR
jgi:hypothetical protein